MFLLYSVYYFHEKQTLSLLFFHNFVSIFLIFYILAVFLHRAPPPFAQTFKFLLFPLASPRVMHSTAFSNILRLPVFLAHEKSRRADFSALRREDLRFFFLLSALLFRRRTDGAFADYPHRFGDHVVLSLRRRAVAQYEIRFLEDRAFGIADIDYSSFASFYHAVFPFTHVFDRRHCRLRYCTPFTAAVGILFYYPLIFLCVFSDKRPPGLNSCSTEKKAPRMCRPSDVFRGKHNKSAERTAGVRSAPICRSAGKITRPLPYSFGTCGIRGIRKHAALLCSSSSYRG